MLKTGWYKFTDHETEYKVRYSAFLDHINILSIICDEDDITDEIFRNEDMIFSITESIREDLLFSDDSKTDINQYPD